MQHAFMMYNTSTSEAIFSFDTDYRSQSQLKVTVRLKKTMAQTKDVMF